MQLVGPASWNVNVGALKKRLCIKKKNPKNFTCVEVELPWINASQLHSVTGGESTLWSSTRRAQKQDFNVARWGNRCTNYTTAPSSGACWVAKEKKQLRLRSFEPGSVFLPHLPGGCGDQILLFFFEGTKKSTKERAPYVRQAGGREGVWGRGAPPTQHSVQFQKKTVGDGRRRPRRLVL